MSLTNERLAELIPHIESALEDGYPLQLKGDDLRFLLEAIKARLSHEPSALASELHVRGCGAWRGEACTCESIQPAVRTNEQAS